MMENGKMMNVMDLEDILVVMVMYMKENGNMIRLMDMVYLRTVTVLFMKVIGRMINKMVMANKNGLMDSIMKGNL